MTQGWVNVHRIFFLFNNVLKEERREKLHINIISVTKHHKLDQEKQMAGSHVYNNNQLTTLTFVPQW